MLDVQLYGLQSGGHHASSVVLHAANSILLFVAFFRLTGKLGRSAFIAAVFAVHPLHVESVAWISERKDVLSTLFWMLTVHAYVSYVRSRRLIAWILVFGAFALGLMSKPMLVTLPFTLLLLDYWPLRRVSPAMVTGLSSWWPLVREKIPLFLLSAVSSVITVKVQGSYGAVVELGKLPAATRIGNAMVSYVDYIAAFLWPQNLAAFYPFHVRSAAAVVAAAMILAAGTYVAVRSARSRPYLLVGWLWYLGTLLPAIGVVQVGDQARADRYTYVPMIGLLLIVAWSAVDLSSGRGFEKALLRVAGSVAILVLTALSIRQASYWRDNLSLFSRAVAVTDGSYRAEALLGVALSEKGQNEEAINHYRASLRILPGNAETHSNLGSALSDLGRTDDALNEFADAVKFKPSSAVFHYNFAVVLNEKGRKTEAIREIRAAMQLDPGNPKYSEALSVLSAAK
jgi:tetratricopeptide (TPR) repeat protein